MKTKLFSLVICSILLGCANTSNTTDAPQAAPYEHSYTREIIGYMDGTYCAEVEYYYSETGTNSTYTLSVEVEDNQLIRIDWPNGGWLDDTHFTPVDIENGTVEFSSDRGVDYTVRILGEEGDCSLSSNAIDEDSLIDQQHEDEYQEEVEAKEEEDRVKEEQEDLSHHESQSEESQQYEYQCTNIIDPSYSRPLTQVPLNITD